MSQRPTESVHSQSAGLHAAKGPVVLARLLDAQAAALQSIFVNLARRAAVQEQIPNFDTFLRLGLKAQAQAVRTIEALAEMKNPRSVAFVQQANLANTPQVNHGPVSQAGSLENQQSKLSGDTYELRQNTGTQSTASGVNPALEALGEIDRAKVARG